MGVGFTKLLRLVKVFIALAPEPKENVNFFIENVERENAESIVLLDLARRSELVEGALGHAREDVDHRIDPVLLITIREAHDLDPKGEESTVEEPIQEKHLA